jgi:hypothetical protein
MILSDVGYTPARQTPVRNRRGNAETGPCAKTIPVFASAAPSADIHRMRGAGKTSVRFSVADITAPATKPSWTAMMSNDASFVPRLHCVRSCGTMADVENHVVMLRTTTTAITVSASRWPGTDT